MIKNYILLFLLISFVNYGQTPTVQWQDLVGGTYADYFKNVIQTSDGGYIALGRSQSTDGDAVGNHGDSDLILVKYSSTGVIQWKKMFGGSDGDEGEAIRQTSDGGYIICGRTYSLDGDALVTHTGGEYWIIKTNDSGAIEWQKSYGGSDYEDAHDIQQTTDGGYIVIGQSHSFNGDVMGHHANGDAWILKLDSTGNLQWQKSYGGSADDLGFAIQQTPDGGYQPPHRVSARLHQRPRVRLLLALLHTHIVEVPVERERSRLSLHFAGQIEDAPAIRTLNDGGDVARFIQRKRDRQAGGLRRRRRLGTECRRRDQRGGDEKRDVCFKSHFGGS